MASGPNTPPASATALWLESEKIGMFFVEDFRHATETNSEQEWNDIGDRAPTLDPNFCRLGLAAWDMRTANLGADRVAKEPAVFVAQARALGRAIQRAGEDAIRRNEAFDALSLLGRSDEPLPDAMARLITAAIGHGGLLHLDTWRLSLQNFEDTQDETLARLIDVMNERCEFELDARFFLAKTLAQQNRMPVLAKMIREGDVRFPTPGQRRDIFDAALQPLGRFLGFETVKNRAALLADAGLSLDAPAFLAGWARCKDAANQHLFGKWFLSRAGMSPESLGSVANMAIETLSAPDALKIAQWATKNGAPIAQSAWDLAAATWGAEPLRQLIALADAGVAWPDPARTLCAAARNPNAQPHALIFNAWDFTPEERADALIAAMEFKDLGHLGTVDRLVKQGAALSSEQLSRALLPAILNGNSAFVGMLLKEGAHGAGPDGRGRPLKEALRLNAAHAAIALARADGWGPEAVEFALRPRAKPSPLIQQFAAKALAIRESAQLNKLIQAESKKQAKKDKETPQIKSETPLQGDGESPGITLVSPGKTRRL